jgi:hypothetical protein
MSKREIEVEVNLEGWYHRGINGGAAQYYHKGQKFLGNAINERMIACLENKETFKNVMGEDIPVLTLNSGTIEELQALSVTDKKEPAKVDEPDAGSETTPVAPKDFKPTRRPR